MKNTLQTTARLALESTEEEKHEARNVEVDTMPERISANLRVPDQAQRSRTQVRSVFKDELELTPETVLEQTEYQSSWPVLLALQPFCRTNQWEARVKRYLPAHARKVRAGYIRHILDNPFFGRGQKRLTPAGLLGRTDSYSRLPVLL